MYQVKSDEESTFAEFIASRGDHLHRAAWLLTGDVQLAEDLVQTVLARVWPKWSRIVRDNPEAYIRRALINTHASWWRRRWRGEHPTWVLPDLPAPRDSFAEVDLEQTLVAAMQLLPPRQRAVIVLRYFEDLTVEDTARALGCHPGTIKSQSAKALRLLRQHLELAQLAGAGELR